MTSISTHQKSKYSYILNNIDKSSSTPNKLHSTKNTKYNHISSKTNITKYSISKPSTFKPTISPCSITYFPFKTKKQKISNSFIDKSICRNTKHNKRFSLDDIEHINQSISTYGNNLTSKNYPQTLREAYVSNSRNKINKTGSFLSRPSSSMDISRSKRRYDMNGGSVNSPDIHKIKHSIIKKDTIFSVETNKYFISPEFNKKNNNYNYNHNNKSINDCFLSQTERPSKIVKRNSSTNISINSRLITTCEKEANAPTPTRNKNNSRNHKCGLQITSTSSIFKENTSTYSSTRKLPHISNNTLKEIHKSVPLIKVFKKSNLGNSHNNIKSSIKNNKSKQFISKEGINTLLIGNDNNNIDKNNTNTNVFSKSKQSNESITFSSNEMNKFNFQNTHNSSKTTETNDYCKSILSYYGLSRAGYEGQKHKKNNQDAYTMLDSFANNKTYKLFCVCDGHGSEGHLVSQYLINMLTNELSHNLAEFCLDDDEPTAINGISRIISATFQLVNSQLEMHPSINTVFSGSTCLSLIYTPPKIIIANTGDSRGIVGRYNALSKKWTHLPLSRDHKPSQEDEAERIIDQGGEIRPFRCKGQDAGPDRVWVKGREIPGLAMSRSFGDRVAETVGVICDPEIKEHYFEQDDKFIILASDGVWEYMKNKECVDLIQHFYMKGDIKGACENLYIECKRRWIKNEGVVDDITMIIIFLE